MYVFNFIKRINDHYVECIKCSRKLKFIKNSKNTSNLWKHGCLPIQKKEESTITQKYYNQSYLNQILLKIIVEDQRSITMFQSEAFKKFFKIFLQDFNNPCYNTLISCMQKNYDNVIKIIQKELESIDFYSFTSDIWTSIAKDHYLGIKIFYFDSNFNIK